MDNWSFYIIKNGNATYAGVSLIQFSVYENIMEKLLVVQNILFHMVQAGNIYV